MEAGFVSADDISTEAAICKLMVLLGEPDLEPEEVEAAFGRDLAGEQSSSLHTAHFFDEPGIAVGGGTPRRLRPAMVPEDWEPHELQRAVIRLHGATLDSDPRDSPTEIEIYLDMNPDEHPDDPDAVLVDRFLRWPNDHHSKLLSFPVTEAIRAASTQGRRVSFTIYIRKPAATLEWTSADIALVTRRH